MWNQLIFWIFDQQRQLHEALIEAVRQSGTDSNGALWLIGLSFLYGLFHAAGPGHGKAVIATYLTAQREQLGRGVAMAVMGAFAQGLTALILVYGLIGLAGWVPRETQGAVSWSERASFFLLALMGLWLLKRAWNAFRSAGNKAHQHHHHGHEHHEHHHHKHEHHAHDEACGCGHTHAPDPAELAARGNSLKAMALIVLAIGLRPCTGAVLVLIFAKVTGHAWTGVMAVAAMSTGTAIAVGTLACMTVFLRGWASARLAAAGQHRAQLAIGQGLVLLTAGAFLLLLGASLLTGSFNTPAHPLGL
jgi:nickel/cobalt transporter (NicO) family protein